MNWNSVEEFQNWWLTNGKPIRPPFKDAAFTTDIAYSLCLFREGKFQVELYISKPNTQAPMHSHPDVDSSFIYLGGNHEFGEPDGSFRDLKDYQKENPENGAHILLGTTLLALSATPHRLRVGPEGGSFLSFEMWREDKPTSVTVHWDGEPVGEQHIETMNKHHA